MTEDLMAMTMEPKPGSLGEMLQESGLFAYMGESDLSHLHCLLRFAALIEARAVARTREECAVEASSWKRSKLLLHAGEMTMQERRTCESVVDGIAAAIRALGERT